MGDMMKFEVSVKQFYHVPLRVTVDSCVATVAANVDTVPRYVFLGNNGQVVCCESSLHRGAFGRLAGLIVPCCLQVSV